MPSALKPAPSALSELLLLQREINALVARLGGASPRHGQGGDWSPRVDVFDSAGAVNVTVEVPGLGAGALRVVGRERRLTISGERRQAPRTGATFHCLERPSGRFSRSVALDTPVDLSRAEATLADGVLTVSLPRLTERRGRDVEIPVRERP